MTVAQELVGHTPVGVLGQLRSLFSVVQEVLEQLAGGDQPMLLR